MSSASSSNHGEGNPEAADNFNSAEQKFVSSERGKKRIQDGPQVQPNEEDSLFRHAATLYGSNRSYSFLTTA